MTKKKKREVLLITGLSGAGLSTVLKSLEDLGYKAVDNLPLPLVDALLSLKEGKDAPVAIALDSRTWGFSAAALLKKRKDAGARLVFIDCADDELQRRFTETRRVHPMAADRPVSVGVALERRLMRDIKTEADVVIDTTDLKAHDLRHLIGGHFTLADDRGLLVNVMSFGFKNGVPREADLVFDVRFLDNPHWDTKLRPLTGLDAAVARKVESDPDYGVFFARMTNLLETLLPRYEREGKSYLTIAIGCTGGKHRSVFTAERLYGWLRSGGHNASIRHRDLERAGLRVTLSAGQKQQKTTSKRKKA